MNVRIAKESFGIANPILKELGNRIADGLLIVGKPGSGKTTILRDLCRQVASGRLDRLYRVSLVDCAGRSGGYF